MDKDINKFRLISKLPIKTDIGTMMHLELAGKHWWYVKRGIKNNEFTGDSLYYFNIYSDLRINQQFKN